MANEIYHRSNWGNAVNDIAWGDTYEKFDATNEMFVRSDNYENSNETDKLMAAINPKPSILLTPTAYDNGSLHSVKPVKTFGSELVTNGDFATDSDWTKGTGWSISGGKANADATFDNLGQTGYSFVINKTYKVTYEVKNYVNGNIRFQLTGGATLNGNTINSNGIYTQYVKATANHTNFRFRGTNFTGSIDNVSIIEVTEADFDFTRGTAATRVNEQGLIEDVQILSGELVQNGDFEQIGSELVTNGTFDNNIDNWTGKSSVISWSNGKLSCDNSSGNSSAGPFQSNVWLDTKIYKVTVTMQLLSGDANGNIRVLSSSATGGSQSTLITGNELTIGGNAVTQTFYLTPDSSDVSIQFACNSSNAVFTIDNVSVKEVGQNWTPNTNATLSIDNGRLKVSISGSASGYPSQNITTVVGKKYKITADAFIGTATKVSLYSAAFGFNDLTADGSYDLTFTATSTSTQIRLYVYGDGSYGFWDNISVIEITDDTNIPRIDYTDGTGSLLLEPQSTNLITYSEDFSQWTTEYFTANSETTIAPNGNTVNGYDFGDGYIFKDTAALDGSSSYTNSIYIKANKSATIGLRKGGASGTDDVDINLTTSWQRFEATSVTSVTSNGRLLLDNRTLKGYGVSDLKVFIFAAQQEKLSYATSYIPTSGSTVTRDADVCNNSGSSDLINSTEGVLYAEIAALADDNTFRMISVSDGTNDNRVRINYTSTSQQIQSRVVVSGVNQAEINKFGFTGITDLTKIALSYKQNEVKFYINGELIGTDTSATMPPADTLNVLNFDGGSGTGDFYGNVKCVAVFKEALTDAELTALTT
jgi:hypothetical protein